MRYLNTGLLLAAISAGWTFPWPAGAQQKAPLTILRQIDASSYDPISTTATATAEIVFMLADTLVTIDFDMKTIKPGLADSWTISPDGLTYTFKLHKGVKFCDGRPMTAEDVVYSLKRWTNPANKSPTATRAGQVRDVRAPDDYTVVYELKQPNSDLLYQLTLYFASIVDKKSVEKLGPNFGVQGFNGTGPYCWVSWTPRDQMVMKKNPYYDWGSPIYKDPRPQIDEIVWKIIPEDNTLMAALQSRRADLSYNLPYLAIPVMQKFPGMTVQQQEHYIYDVYMGFKVDKPVVNDRTIRQAVNMAVNKEALVKAVFHGVGSVLPGLLNANAPDYDAEAAKKMPKYDPAGAAALLDQAGWLKGADGVRAKDGLRASFTVYGIRMPFFEMIAQAIQADLRRIGIEMKVQLWDATIVWSKLSTQEFDALLMSYPYVTATEALNSYFASRQIPTPNRMNWKDPKTDELLAAATTATRAEDRKRAIGEVQSLLTEANVWVPLASEPLWLVSGDRVEDARVHGLWGAGLYKGLDMKLKR
ncbi:MULTISPECIES: ABC transporter substrate-binding protein [unclassified Bradyrhizobium]|uniref:ABC transporter substrate-binding protein n=1 Tax=Bradyrhizobium sp. USDA 4541 TaxID=2817704 RepID=UPI0020A23C84|nr:ABC transporter substrate-binding protein [Bradyrhizobium sp. USDA 4541]MCP1848128.1 peptide/nickel transport system substrate-binding protein [Bradyrhizobium sp. USDA 4541]